MVYILFFISLIGMFLSYNAIGPFKNSGKSGNADWLAVFTVLLNICIILIGIKWMHELAQDIGLF